KEDKCAIPRQGCQGSGGEPLTPVERSQRGGCQAASETELPEAAAIFRAGLQSERASHGTSCACARRVESEPVKRDEPLAVKIRPEVSPRKDKRDGNAPHPTP